jgi:ABC-type transport system substrate-binding protein
MLRRIATTCVLGALLLGGGVLGGCARRAPQAAAIKLRWLAGRTAPAFDPDGPAEPVRRALESLLSFGLFARDSAGATHPLAVERLTWSDGGRTLTLRLRAGLRFTDGTPAGSADFRNALLAGLAREDHATTAWLLAPVTGMDRVRAGRPLPALGIEAPDPLTLVLRLARADSSLIDRLACPGIGVPWRARAGIAWGEAVGLGPYRVLHEEPARALTIVRAATGTVLRPLVDTLEVRFAVGAPRVRYALRHLAADLVWPLPPALLSEPLPAGHRLVELDARPVRRLLLVFRCDVPPTTRLPARAALAHALNRGELLAALGRGAADSPWLDGAGPFEFPRLDAEATREWLARGDLGASFHVVLAFDADGAGAEIARLLQGQWAGLGLYAELRPLRGGAALAEALRASAAQVQLVEAQAPLPGAAGELATLLLPLRGPAVGSFRTGWRTREFDPWTAGPDPAPGFDPVAAQARLADEVVALPLATLPWRWVLREGGPAVPFDPWNGPALAMPVSTGTARLTSGSGSD